MTNITNILLNSTNATLVIFATAATIAGFFSKAPIVRFGAGIVGIALTMCIMISTRSLFGWTVSTIEQPSFPGFVLLAVLAISATTGWRVEALGEFRFVTLILALAGFALYPGAMGFLDADPYVVGYSGYLLPAAVALVIAYAIWRGYFLTALTLNIAIALFLLNAGVSRNLWDYIMDPVAWFIGVGTWVAIAGGFVIGCIKPSKALAPAQPSSGIGETPISH